MRYERTYGGGVLLSFVPVLVLLLGLSATYAFYANSEHQARQALQQKFDFRVAELIQNIQRRLTGYGQVLRGEAGLFSIAPFVSRTEFHDYVSELHLSTHYPGVQGVGFSLAVLPQDRSKHIRSVQQDGFPEYAIWPAGQRDLYTTILYLEPFDWRNRRAFGYDMYSEPVRREAMARARDENRMAVTGKVKLVQEAGQQEQAGFLMYVPVYRKGMPHDSLADRRTNILGWAYAPFRMNDLMQGVSGAHFGEIKTTLDVEIYDGPEATASSLMFDSNQHNSQPLSPVFKTRRNITLGGRQWTVAVHSLPQFELALHSDKANLIAIAGSSASVLFALLMWIVINGRSRVMRLAERMNQELIEAGKLLQTKESYLQGVLDNLPAGVVVYGADRIIQYGNASAARALALSPEELVGLHVADEAWTFLHPEGSRIKDEDLPLNRVLSSREAVTGQLMGVDLGNNRGVLWALVNAYPDSDLDGSVKRVVVSFVDITPIMAAEASLRKALEELDDLYDHAPCGYHSLDRDGYIVRINQTELDWLGYTQDELVGKKKFYELLTPKSQLLFQANFPDFLQRGWVKDLDYKLVRKDGSLMPVLLSATAIRDADGNVVMSRSTVFDNVERKRSELDLRESEQYTRLLLENLSAGVVIHNADATIAYMNTAATVFFGKVSEAVQGQEVADLAMHLMHEDGTPLALEERPERWVLEQGLPLQNKVFGVVFGDESQPRWALLNAFEHPSKKSGRQVVVTFVDITERVQAEIALRHARAELERILDVNPAATYQIRLGGNQVHFLSESVSAISGYSLDEWQQTGFWADHLHPDDRQHVIQAQADLPKLGALAQEYRFRHKDGHWIWIFDRINLIRDAQGRPLELVGAWLDITARKLAEIRLEHLNRVFKVISKVNEAILRLREKEELYQIVARTCVEEGGFVMAWVGEVRDKEGDILPVQVYGREDGYLEVLREAGVLQHNGPTAQAIKQGAWRLSEDIAIDPVMAPWREEALRRGYRSSGAFPIRQGAQVIGALTLYAPVAHFFTEEVLYLVEELALDLSFALDFIQQQQMRREAEQAVRQLNADLERRVQDRTRQLELVNEELESFSYSVSHDLRAPLRSIDGFSDMLQRAYGDMLDGRGQDYLGRIRRASKRMGELIDDLLMLAKVSRGELRKTTVDLSDMAAKLASELQADNPARQAEWQIENGLRVQADARLLKVVLENLLGNAWKFTARRPVAQIEVGMQQNPGERIFYVRDNGAGFDMKYASKLFGAFQRLHKEEDFEGTGIGLVTVQRIIHRHGGRVWAEGQVGVGATVYFVL